MNAPDHNNKSKIEKTNYDECVTPWVSKKEDKYIFLDSSIFLIESRIPQNEQEMQIIIIRLLKLFAALPDFYAHFGGAGDALLLFSTFYDEKPSSIIFSYANSIDSAKSLFDAFPSLNTVYFLPMQESPVFHSILRCIVYTIQNCLGAGATPKEDYNEWNSLIDIEKKYCIKKSPAWAGQFKKNIRPNQIAIAPKGSAFILGGTKPNVIPIPYWHAIILYLLKRGYEPIILGIPSEVRDYPLLPGCIDARSYCFLDQMHVIGQSVALIAADSWAKTFSGLANIPTLVFEPQKPHNAPPEFKYVSDWVFIEPWPSIKMIDSIEEFPMVFEEMIKNIDHSMASA